MTVSLKITVLAAGLMLLAAPTLAQTPPTANQRALAAGYKALTTCSAVHTAREAGASRSPASVETNELVGIYPELQSQATETTSPDIWAVIPATRD